MKYLFIISFYEKYLVLYFSPRKPEPIMADPERCPLTQHQETCVYKFPRCKKCKILGWYTSDVPGDWFDDVPEGGLEYGK